MTRPATASSTESSLLLLLLLLEELLDQLPLDHRLGRFCPL
jgi:hypothetical protein